MQTGSELSTCLSEHTHSQETLSFEKVTVEQLEVIFVWKGDIKLIVSLIRSSVSVISKT